MKFGMSEMGFPYEDLDRSFECIAAAGYDGVEIQLGEDRLDDPGEVGRIRDQAADHGLEIPTVIASGCQGASLAHPDPGVREECVAAATEMVEDVATDVLDVETILMVAGAVTEEIAYDTAYEHTRSSIRELASVCADNDVTLALENVWNDFLLSPLEFATFVDDASEAGPVGAYYDVGNTMKTGYPQQWIEILDDRIDKLHVKDYDTDVDNHRGFTYPTQGDVPWEAVADAVESIGYDDWVTVEVAPYETHPGHMPSQVLENLRATFEAGSNAP